MKRLTTPILVASAAVLAWPATAAPTVDEDGFARYQVILSRKPFGDAPIEEAAPPPPVVSAAESFARSLRICAITQPAGDPLIKVGIVDKAANNSVTTLRVGEESQTGITLISADLDKEEAVLQKGDEIVMLKLGEEPVKQLTKADVQKKAPPTKRPANYADRRRQRREEVLAKQEERLAQRPPPKYTGVELRQHLREYNMEAIRQGLPALPIELSPEEDLQLVAEGVLPPSENTPMPVLAELIQATAEAEAGFESPPAAAPPLLESLPPDFDFGLLEQQPQRQLTQDELDALSLE